MADAHICVGQDVAIVPHANSKPADVLEIAKVYHVGPVCVILADGRMFVTVTGRAVNCAGYIVPATDKHREALAKRQSGNAAMDS